MATVCGGVDLPWGNPIHAAGFGRDVAANALGLPVHIVKRCTEVTVIRIANPGWH